MMIDKIGRRSWGLSLTGLLSLFGGLWPRQKAYAGSPFTTWPLLPEWCWEKEWLEVPDIHYHRGNNQLFRDRAGYRFQVRYNTIPAKQEGWFELALNRSFDEWFGPETEVLHPSHDFTRHRLTMLRDRIIKYAEQEQLDASQWLVPLNETIEWVTEMWVTEMRRAASIPPYALQQ